MNLQKMLKQAQDMQSKIAEVQAKLETEETEGSSGGGMVVVRLNGKGQMLKLALDPKLIDPSEKEMLEDLIVAAFNDAKGKVETSFSDQMNKVAGNLGLPPGFKMPF
jgi:DNA-binding YbaB/EbfC family protein